ncbi:hypothetical protein BJ165DRAFT_1411305 [Panaeolus papilionaceus]|nr:hypothetical protein BJ165DRAFT_1411305 [Panaeolus papilionaceus]
MPPKKPKYRQEAAARATAAAAAVRNRKYPAPGALNNSQKENLGVNEARCEVDQVEDRGVDCCLGGDEDEEWESKGDEDKFLEEITGRALKIHQERRIAAGIMEDLPENHGNPTQSSQTVSSAFGKLMACGWPLTQGISLREGPGKRVIPWQAIPWDSKMTKAFKREVMFLFEIWSIFNPISMSLLPENVKARLSMLRSCTEDEVHRLAALNLPPEKVPNAYIDMLSAVECVFCLRASLICWEATSHQQVPRKMQLRTVLAEHFHHEDVLVVAGTGSSKTLPMALSVLMEDPAQDLA